MFNSFSKFSEKNGSVKFHYMSISAIVKQNKQTKKFMYIKNNKKSIMYLKDTGSLTLKNKILWIVWIQNIRWKCSRGSKNSQKD